MDFLQSGQSAKERICQGMTVNEIILGQVESANRASSLAATEHFVNHNINPKISLISQCLTSWFAWRYRDPALLVYLEECRVSDPDEARADLTLAARFGACTINELRAAAGLPALPDGDKLVKPAPAGGQGGAADGGNGGGKDFPSPAANGNGHSRLVLP
jgi:hypothetical protein